MKISPQGAFESPMLLQQRAEIPVRIDSVRFQSCHHMTLLCMKFLWISI